VSIKEATPSPAPLLRVVDLDFYRKGDVNWDGKIDQKDLDAIKAHLGTMEGAPNYDPIYDLNNDGKIDMIDLANVLANFGLTAPEYETPARAEVVSGKVVVIGYYKGQELRREFTASSNRVIFVFSFISGLWGRVVVI